MWLCKILIILLLLMQSYLMDLGSENEDLNMKTGENVSNIIEDIHDSVLFPIGFPIDFKLTIPEKNKNGTFCKYVPNYPQATISRIISMLPSKNLKLYIDKPEDQKIVDINNSTFEYEYYKMCTPKWVVITPQAARDADNSSNWHLVLNSDDDNKQNLSGRICTDVAKNFSDIATFPTGYHGECSQRTWKKKLLALDLDMKNVIDLRVAVPICCTCVVKPNYS